MTDHFDTWINGMTEDEYEDWLEDTATDNQEQAALNIRTPLSQQEEQDMLDEQTFEDIERQEQEERVREEEARQRGSRVEVLREEEPEEIYDNRDLEPIIETRQIEIPRDGSPPRVLPKQTRTQQIQREYQTIQPQTPIQPSSINQTITPNRVTMTGIGTRPVQKVSFRQRVQTRISTSIRNTFSSITNIFRRNKK